MLTSGQKKPPLVTDVGAPVATSKLVAHLTRRTSSPRHARYGTVVSCGFHGLLLAGIVLQSLGGAAPAVPTRMPAVTATTRQAPRHSLSLVKTFPTLI